MSSDNNPSWGEEAGMDVSCAIASALSVLNEESMEQDKYYKRKLEEEVNSQGAKMKIPPTREELHLRSSTPKESPNISSLANVSVNTNIISNPVEDISSDSSSPKPLPDKPRERFAQYINNMYEHTDRGPFVVYIENLSRKGKIHPMFIGKLLRLNCLDIYKNIISLNKIDNWSLKIEINNYLSANKLKDQTFWKENNLICYVPGFLIYKQGLIRDVAYCLSDEEIVEYSIADKPVVKAKRIHKIINDKKVPTPLAILTFRGQYVPREIKILEVLCKVDPYIPKVIQCRKCYRFGHFSSSCSANPKCCRCAEEHPQDLSCLKQISCINCKGEHFATFSKCPEYLRQKQIKSLMVEKNLSFKEVYISVKKTTYADKVSESTPNPMLQVDSNTNTNSAQEAPPSIDLANCNYQSKTHKTITIHNRPRSPRPKEAPHFQRIENISNSNFTNSPVITDPIYIKNVNNPEKFKGILNNILKKIISDEISLANFNLSPEDSNYFTQELYKSLNIDQSRYHNIII